MVISMVGCVRNGLVGRRARAGGEDRVEGESCVRPTANTSSHNELVNACHARPIKVCRNGPINVCHNGPTNVCHNRPDNVCHNGIVHETTVSHHGMLGTGKQHEERGGDGRGGGVDRIDPPASRRLQSNTTNRRRKVPLCSKL